MLSPHLTYTYFLQILAQPCGAQSSRSSVGIGTLPDAERRLADDVLASLESIGARLQPPKPSTLHRWLFDEWRPNLGDSRRDEVERYDRELTSARVTAVRDISTAKGFQPSSILPTTLSCPWAIGASLAEVTDLDADADIVQLLDAPSNKLQQFALAFARSRDAADTAWMGRWVDQYSGQPDIQALSLDALVVSAVGPRASIKSSR